MPSPGCIGTDETLGHVPDGEGVPEDREEPAFLLLECVKVDRRPGMGERGSCREETGSPERKVHHDPVEGPRKKGGETGCISEDGEDVSCPVPADVAQEQPDGAGVEVACNDEGRFPREGEGKGSHAGEHVEHPLAGPGTGKDPLPLGGEAGREVCPGEVDREHEAVFAVFRLGRVLPGKDQEPPCPVLSLDVAEGIEGRVEGRTGGKEAFCTGNVLVLDNCNPPDQLVPGEVRWGGQGLELCPERPLARGPDGKEDPVPLLAWTETGVKETIGPQILPDLLSPALRDPHAPLLPHPIPPFPLLLGLLQEKGMVSLPERKVMHHPPLSWYMDEYLERLKAGSLKLYALEQEMPPAEAIALRRRYIEGETGVSLAKVGSFSIAVDRVARKNCENMVGTVQVPVGVAGPLLVRGEHATGTFYLPLATTEGALVASVNRGCAAITRAGGAEVRILRDGMTRAPVFSTRSVIHAREVADWVAAHGDEVARAAESTTSHGKFLGATCTVVGTSVFVRMEFDTKDAMGMNMVTIGSEKAAEVISAATGARLVALSGNLCTDKKPAAVNVVRGRGRSVVAGVFLPDDLIGTVLKTDARSLVEVNMRKNLVGSAAAGSLGYNAHAANVVAALFIACGQDPAHVVEGSLATTTADPVDGGVYVAVTLPDLPVGTVGGGTGVETQAECLSLLGVAGGGDPPGTHARKFAEIVAAGVLAGELSLLGALAAQHLARAHKTLGR